MPCVRERDPDETEGRRLYRASADSLARAQMAVARRKIRMRMGGRVYKRKVRTYSVELSPSDLKEIEAGGTVKVYTKGGAEVQVSAKPQPKQA